MYDPKGNGKDKAVDAVQFVESAPPEHLRTVVHRFLELKTESPLPEDYKFHALPNACAYIVFDQTDHTITGVSKLRAASEEFDLGRSFHFVNIRFLPGVWQDEQEPISYGQLNTAYQGSLPLVALGRDLSKLDFEGKQALLIRLVETLIERKMVCSNPVTATILSHLDEIHTVSDIAELCDISARQLQRILKRTTGFAPHDFLKVLRLQQALSGDEASYAEQSHFIHSFRRATGYTPGKYNKKFDV